MWQSTRYLLFDEGILWITIRVIIIDEQPLFRAGIRATLEPWAIASLWRVDRPSRSI